MSIKQLLQNYSSLLLKEKERKESRGIRNIKWFEEELKRIDKALKEKA